MGLFKRTGQPLVAPGVPCAYISGGQPFWAYLGFWQDRGRHITLFQAQRITDLVPDLIQNLCNLRHLRHKARIIQELLDWVLMPLVVPGYHLWTGIQLALNLEWFSET